MNDGGAIRVAFRGRLGSFQLDAAFTAPATGITALFGPSGCGKTTVLRCIAGLERVADGLCAIEGDVWQDASTFRPAFQRPIGYVFQEASLFSHISVRRNLLYGAARDGGGDARFDEVIELLGLRKLLDRAPRNLSGGERQRVAIGRALLSKPRLLLMDEPLSALDRATKDEILPFLERLHATLALPVIYVSHDIREVERLADYLVLMEAGCVRAAGPLQELQSDPTLPLAASSDAAVNFEALLSAYDPGYGIATWSVGSAAFMVPGAAEPMGTRRRLRVGANDVSLAIEAPEASTILNVVPVRIVSATPVEQEQVVVLLALSDGGPRLLARVTRRSWEQLRLAEGLRVYAQVKAVALAAVSQA